MEAAIMLSLLAAMPLDPGYLVPGREDLDKAMTRSNELLVRAEAIGSALERVHNRWGELARLRKQRKLTCKDAEPLSLALRSRLLGDALRDAVQAARAQRRRLDLLLLAPTVAPLVDAATRRETEAIAQRVEVAERGFMEAVAWHHRWIEREVHDCPLVITGAGGIRFPMPIPAKERNPSVAVVAIGGGRVCPGDHRADGRVVVLGDGRGCWTNADHCDCVPVITYPGAVLGPPPVATSTTATSTAAR